MVQLIWILNAFEGCDGSIKVDDKQGNSPDDKDRYLVRYLLCNCEVQELRQ